VIVDTSALMAVFLGEPLAEVVVRTVREAAQPKISAPTLVELFTVADRRLSPAARSHVEAAVVKLRIGVVPFDVGDTYSYALAAVTGEPLLFVGDDFTHTDIRAAI
jgi:ribonuclease VapC